MFAAAVALVFLRGLPAITGLLGRAASRFISVPLWLAVAQISRRSGSNRALLFLLIFTVALGLFSATFAGTLDTHYADVVRYAVGSDLVIQVQWEQVGGATERRWRYPPFAVVRSVPGVEAATRVLRQPVFVDGLEGNVNATVLGIDPRRVQPGRLVARRFFPGIPGRTDQQAGAQLDGRTGQPQLRRGDRLAGG